MQWLNNQSLSIVLCSKGYPDNYENNIEIKNLEKITLERNHFIFHAGTYKDGEKIFSKGGRVLNFVSLCDNFSKARKENIQNLLNLNWSEGYYRKDIGFKVIEK